MSQRIVTEERFGLGPNADLTEDVAIVEVALWAAFDEAIGLGGHQQKLRSITVKMDHDLGLSGGVLSRAGRVVIETELT